MFHKLSLTNDNESTDEESSDEDSIKENRTIRDMVHKRLYSFDEYYDDWDDVIDNNANMLKLDDFDYNGEFFKSF